MTPSCPFSLIFDRTLGDLLGDLLGEGRRSGGSRWRYRRFFLEVSWLFGFNGALFSWSQDRSPSELETSREEADPGDSDRTGECE
jgi:hypothetical protein